MPFNPYLIALLFVVGVIAILVKSDDNDDDTPSGLLNRNTPLKNLTYAG